VRAPSSIKDRSFVGKEKPHNKPAPAAAAPAKPGWRQRLARLPAAARAKPVWAAAISVGAVLAIIGLAMGGTLIFGPGPTPSYMQRLANAFGELEKGNRVQARQLAARLLIDQSVSYADHGGAYFILGAVTLRDADDQLSPKRRQLLDLVAARYLDEARSRGMPQTRQAEGLFMLGRALHDAGRFERSIAILREAMELAPEQGRPLHELLANCYLRMEPPKLTEALEHNRQYLASPNLLPAQHDAGKLLEARILLAQKELSAAEQAVGAIAPESPLHAKAVILRGRILHEALSAGSEREEGATDVAAMQEDLRKLLSRESSSTTIAPQAQILIGLLAKALGDSRGAIQQFDLVRRTYFGQSEALAATLYHAELTQDDHPQEAATLYKRALLQASALGQDYDATWLTLNDFRKQLSSAIDALASRGYFSEAIELAEGLTTAFSQTIAVERQAQIERAWAAQLEQRADKEGMPAAEATAAEARRHRRQAGALWRKLADLRLATRHYFEDLASSADDFRRGHGFQQAAGVYRELLAHEPQEGKPEALVGLGESLLSLGKTADALTVLDQCRLTYSRHPASYQARLLSNLALQEQGKLAEAQELLIDNLYRFSLTPQSGDWRDSLFALGALLYRQAMDLEGQSRLSGVDRPDPAARRPGLQLLEQSHAAFEEAIRTLSEAVERYPTAPQAMEARYRIAEAYRHSAKLPRKRLRDVTIETSRTLLTRQMHEQLQLAVDGYSALINQVSDQQGDELRTGQLAILRNCYFGRADALFDLGRYPEAIQAYSAATNRYQHDPESLEAYVQIASCHRRLGRLNEARGTIEQARVVLQRIRPDADFVRTTRLGRQDWAQLLDWLKTL
jgi:tetratricopeptide (TPR) repeat protein